jgi:hypothetical protein
VLDGDEPGWVYRLQPFRTRSIVLFARARGLRELNKPVTLFKGENDFGDLPIDLSGVIASGNWAH